MLLTKYQGSRPCGFRKEDFFHGSTYMSICKAFDHWGGAIFGPGDKLNKLGRSLLGNATYQGSRTYGFRQYAYVNM